ncbi:MAG TPA: IS110 family transposase [Vicinamibacteria bacterium]
MKTTTIAVDVATAHLEIAVSNGAGRVTERRRLARSRVLPYFRKQPSATVLLEACASAHHWARELQGLGHKVVLLPPHAVRPYVTRNKTDKTDAKALLEAYRNEDIRPVPVKSPDQQALAAIHRLRSGWVATRTARLNALRGFAKELGLVIPTGVRHVALNLRAALEDADSPIPYSLRPLLAEGLAEIAQLDARIRLAEKTLASLAENLPAVARLRSIPGIGPLTSTALVAFVGDVQRFPSGRHFASYLGLTPRERSSGKTRRLGAISKRGDPYLRKLLVQGARAVLWAARARKEPGRLRSWALRIEKDRGHNKAAVALANKLARIAWAVWRKDVPFQEV